MQSLTKIDQVQLCKYIDIGKLKCTVLKASSCLHTRQRCPKETSAVKISTRLREDIAREKNVTKCNRKAGQSGRQFLRNGKLVRIVCDLFFAWLPVVSCNGLFLVFSRLKSYFVLEFVLGVAGEQWFA